MAWLLGLLMIASPEAERLLLGPSPFFRREGVELATREGDEALLVRAARSGPWDARRFAALALGPRTPPELLNDRVAAVREAALVALDLAAPEEVALPLLADPDDAVRAAAAWALRGRAKPSALRALAKDPWPSVRVAALAASGDAGALRVLASDADPGDAVPALAALGRLDDATTRAFLLGQFEALLNRPAKRAVPLFTAERPHAQLALARAFGESVRGGLPGKIKKLLDGGRLDANDLVLLAEAAAGARDAEWARKLLDRMLRERVTSPQPDYQFAAPLHSVLHAFGREAWPELAPLLIPFLDNPDAGLRLKVVEALHGDAAIPALRDDDPAVRAAACRRVRRVASLAERANDPSPVVLCACARALGRLGDPQAGPALAALAAHEDAAVRRAAVGGLLRLPLPDRVARIYALASRDPVERVRASASAALGLLDDAAAVDLALEDLGAAEIGVRRNAIALLRALTPARHEYDPEHPAAGWARWREWWKGGREQAAASDAFRYHVEDLRKRGIDLVLTLDATGSMTNVIQATKRRIVQVVDSLRDVVPDVRLRVVAYRDRGDAFVAIGSPFTHDPRVIEDYLAGVPACGGGDPEEAVLDGLREAFAGTPWRKEARRIVLLFGDAPPHDKDRPLLEATLKEFAGTVHAVDVNGYQYALGGLGAMPVGSPPQAPFREIAAWGRGTAVRLSDEDDLLRNLLVLTLGAEFRESIEALFGL